MLFITYQLVMQDVFISSNKGVLAMNRGGEGYLYLNKVRLDNRADE